MRKKKDGKPSAGGNGHDVRLCWWGPKEGTKRGGPPEGVRGNRGKRGAEIKWCPSMAQRIE